MLGKPIYLTSKDVIRFEKKFAKTEGCWNWNAYCNKYGYGTFRLGDTHHRAHRVAYTLYVGPIPAGVCVLHRCDNPRCINPIHLFLGTRADNMRDMENKGRSKHPYGELNGRAKLTEIEVLAIREIAGQPGYTYQSLADRFGVSPVAICHIVNGKTWTCVGGLVEV